jgi:hypothetical protein
VRQILAFRLRDKDGKRRPSGAAEVCSVFVIIGLR